MSSIWSKIKGIIGIVAPTVASVIGTPRAGIVTKGLLSILGLDENSSPTEILKKVSNMDVETIVKLKELETNTQIKLRELDIDSEKIAQEDRGSARDTEVSLIKMGRNNNRKTIIMFLVFGGFFFILFALYYGKISPDLKDILFTLIGYLFGCMDIILNYEFGSSSSSSKKNELLAKMKME